MIIPYAEYIGDIIEQELNKNGILVRHAKEYYGPLTVDAARIKSDMSSRRITTSFFVINLRYSYITNFSCTKYFTENSQGEIRLWNYDFNNFLPGKCIPELIICNTTEDHALKIQQLLINLFANVIKVKIPHPILSEELIPLKLISTKHNTEFRSDENNRFLISCFDHVTIPLSVSKSISDKSTLTDKTMQLIAIGYIKTLFQLNDNASAYYSNVSQKNEAERTHAREIITSVNDSRIKLLQSLEIPESLWTMDNVNHIIQVLRGPDGDRGLWKICSEMDERIKKAESEEAKKWFQDAIAKQIHNGEYSNDYGCEYDYSETYSTSAGSSSGFFSELAASMIANHGIKKALKEQNELLRQQESRRKMDEYLDRSKRARQSQYEWEQVRKANMERRRKGLPDLPYPDREYW